MATDAHLNLARKFVEWCEREYAKEGMPYGQRYEDLQRWVKDMKIQEAFFAGFVGKILEDA